MTVYGLFGIESNYTPGKINQRAYKRNRCTNCGAFPKIHKTRDNKFYCKCHGDCCHWGYECKTRLCNTPDEAVKIWNENNQKEQNNDR